LREKQPAQHNSTAEVALNDLRGTVMAED
jgi:hypothetical protein